MCWLQSLSEELKSDVKSPKCSKKKFVLKKVSCWFFCEFENNGDKTESWMNDFRFYVLFNSISVISEQWEGDNERLWVMEPLLRWKDFRL